MRTIMSMGILSAEERKEAYREQVTKKMMELRNSGCSNAEIATQLGCGVWSVRQYIGSQPLEMTKKNMKERARGKLKYTAEDMLALREQGWSNRDIASHFEVDRTTVTHWIGAQPKEITRASIQRSVTERRARVKSRADAVQAVQESAADSNQKFVTVPAPAIPNVDELAAAIAKHLLAAFMDAMKKSA